MRLRTISTHLTKSICSVEGGAGGDGGGGGGGGDAAAAAAAAAAAGGGGSAAYYESFTNEGLRTNPSVQNFKTVEELAHGYVSLEKRFGIDPARRLDLPADPERQRRHAGGVFEKLGLPEKPTATG
jgi:hypothetical protein